MSDVSYFGSFFRGFQHTGKAPGWRGQAQEGGCGAVSGEGGAVLLEVVLALVLFVGAATVLTSGLSSSIDGVDRLRRNTHAADYAVTVLSELQMGIQSLTMSGPQPFNPPLEGWTWEAVATPPAHAAEEGSPFQTVEVIIRHESPPLVFRVNQVLRLGEAKAGQEKLPGIDGF